MTPTAISLDFRLAVPADAPTLLGFIEEQERQRSAKP